MPTDDTSPRWRWLLFPLLALAFAAGAVAAPALPFGGDGDPRDGSVEVGFARDMQVHHQQAIRMSLLAALRSSDTEVRTLAVDIAATQQAQVGRMAGWLEQWDVERTTALPPMSWMDGQHGGGHELLPDGRMPGMATEAQLAELSAATGEEFDRVYLALLAEHHRGGVPMAVEAAARTDEPSVQELASSVAAGQSSELRVLERMLAARS